MSATTAEALDITALAAGECPCEYNHPGDVMCAAPVTHRVVACSVAFNACLSAVAVVRDRIAARNQCIDCHRVASQCWSIYPV